MPHQVDIRVYIYSTLYSNVPRSTFVRSFPLSILGLSLQLPHISRNRGVQRTSRLLRASLIHSRDSTRGEPVFLHRSGRAIGSGKNIQTRLPACLNEWHNSICSDRTDPEQHIRREAADNSRRIIVDLLCSNDENLAITDRATIPILRDQSTNFRRVVVFRGIERLQTLALRVQRVGCKFERRRDPIRHDR